MKGKKERSLKLNIVASMSIQVVSLLVNLISKRAIRLYLGVEYLGLQSVYSNFSELMTFAYVGVGTAMMFSMYGALARNDEEEITSYYKYYDKIYQNISKIVLVGSICCTLLVLYSVNGDISVLEICITYLTYVLSIVLYNRQSIRYYFIQADQRRYVAAFVTGGVDAIALIVEIIILCCFKNYQGFLICILVKNLIINYLFKKYLQKNYDYIFKKAPELEEKEKNSIITNVKDLVVYRFGKVLINNTDSIFISRFTSTMLVGIYSNYQFVILGIRSVLAALFEAIKGKVGLQAQTESLDGQYRNFRKYLCLNAWLLGCSIVCFYFLIEDFIYIWMGNVDSLAQSAIILIIVNYYIDESQTALRTYRETAGLFRNIKTMIIVKGVANIVLSMIMGKIWGIMGVLVATTVTSIATLFWYEPRIIYGYFKKSIWNEALYHVISIALIAISFGLTFLVVNNMQGAGIVYLLFKGVICFITSNIVYAVLAGISLLMRGKTHEW